MAWKFRLPSGEVKSYPSQTDDPTNGMSYEEARGRARREIDSSLVNTIDPLNEAAPSGALAELQRIPSQVEQGGLDFANRLGAGAAGIVQGLGSLLTRIDPTAESSRREGRAPVGDMISNASQDWMDHQQQTLSPELLHHLNNGNMLDPVSLGTYAVQSAPSLVPVGIATALGSPLAGAAVEGAMGHGQIASQIDQTVRQFAADDPQAFMNSATGQKALQETGGNYSRAVELAANRAKGLWPEIGGAADIAAGRFLGEDWTPLLRGGASGAAQSLRRRLAQALLSGSKESAEEFLQSGGEQLASNLGAASVNPQQDIGAGVLEQSVQGALSALPLGAGLGAIRARQGAGPTNVPPPNAGGLGASAPQPVTPGGGGAPPPDQAALQQQANERLLASFQQPQLNAPQAEPAEVDHDAADSALAERVTEYAGMHGVRTGYDVDADNNVRVNIPPPGPTAKRTIEPIALHRREEPVTKFAQEFAPILQGLGIDPSQTETGQALNALGETLYPARKKESSPPAGYGVRITDTLPSGKKRNFVFHMPEAESLEEAADLARQAEELRDQQRATETPQAEPTIRTEDVDTTPAAVKPAAAIEQRGVFKPQPTGKPNTKGLVDREGGARPPSIIRVQPGGNNEESLQRMVQQATEAHVARGASKPSLSLTKRTLGVGEVLAKQINDRIDPVALTQAPAQEPVATPAQEQMPVEQAPTEAPIVNAPQLTTDSTRFRDIKKPREGVTSPRSTIAVPEGGFENAPEVRAQQLSGRPDAKPAWSANRELAEGGNPTFFAYVKKDDGNYTIWTGAPHNLGHTFEVDAKRFKARYRLQKPTSKTTGTDTPELNALREELGKKNIAALRGEAKKRDMHGYSKADHAGLVERIVHDEANKEKPVKSEQPAAKTAPQHEELTDDDLSNARKLGAKIYAERRGSPEAARETIYKKLKLNFPSHSKEDLAKLHDEATDEFDQYANPDDEQPTVEERSPVKRAEDDMVASMPKPEPVKRAEQASPKKPAKAKKVERSDDDILNEVRRLNVLDDDTGYLEALADSDLSKEDIRKFEERNPDAARRYSEILSDLKHGKKKSADMAAQARDADEKQRKALVAKMEQIANRVAAGQPNARVAGNEAVDYVERNGLIVNGKRVKVDSHHLNTLKHLAFRAWMKSNPQSPSLGAPGPRAALSPAGGIDIDPFGRQAVDRVAENELKLHGNLKLTGTPDHVQAIKEFIGRWAPRVVKTHPDNVMDAIMYAEALADHWKESHGFELTAPELQRFRRAVLNRWYERNPALAPPARIPGQILDTLQEVFDRNLEKSGLDANLVIQRTPVYVGGEEAYASYDPGSRMIAMSTRAVNPEGTIHDILRQMQPWLSEEMMHAARDTGTISDTQWNALKDFVEKSSYTDEDAKLIDDELTPTGIPYFDAFAPQYKVYYRMSAQRMFADRFGGVNFPTQEAHDNAYAGWLRSMDQRDRDALLDATTDLVYEEAIGKALQVATARALQRGQEDKVLSNISIANMPSVVGVVLKRLVRMARAIASTFSNRGQMRAEFQKAADQFLADLYNGQFATPESERFVRDDGGEADENPTKSRQPGGEVRLTNNDGVELTPAQLSKAVTKAFKKRRDFPLANFIGNNKFAVLDPQEIDRFERAAALKSEGKDNISIWQRTGVAYDPHTGEPSIRLDNRTMQFRDEPMRWIHEGNGKQKTFTLDQLVDAPNLFKKVPVIGQLKVMLHRHSHNQTDFDVHALETNRAAVRLAVNGNDEMAMRRNLAHELDHMLSALFHFSQGANPVTLYNFAKRVNDKAGREGMRQFDEATGYNRIDQFFRDKGMEAISEVNQARIDAGMHPFTPEVTEMMSKAWALYYATKGEVAALESEDALTYTDEQMQNAPDFLLQETTAFNRPDEYVNAQSAKPTNAFDAGVGRVSQRRLSRKVFDVSSHYGGSDTFEVVRSPSEGDVARMMRLAERENSSIEPELRWLRDKDGTIYIGRADVLVHDDIASAAGYQPMQFRATPENRGIILRDGRGFTFKDETDTQPFTPLRELFRRTPASPDGDALNAALDATPLAVYAGIAEKAEKVGETAPIKLAQIINEEMGRQKNITPNFLANLDEVVARRLADVNEQGFFNPVERAWNHIKAQKGFPKEATITEWMSRLKGANVEVRPSNELLQYTFRRPEANAYARKLSSVLVSAREALDKYAGAGNDDAVEDFDYAIDAFDRAINGKRKPEDSAAFSAFSVERMINNAVILLENHGQDDVAEKLQANKPDLIRAWSAFKNDNPFEHPFANLDLIDGHKYSADTIEAIIRGNAIRLNTVHDEESVGRIPFKGPLYARDGWHSWGVYADAAMHGPSISVPKGVATTAEQAIAVARKQFAGTVMRKPGRPPGDVMFGHRLTNAIGNMAYETDINFALGVPGADYSSPHSSRKSDPATGKPMKGTYVNVLSDQVDMQIGNEKLRGRLATQIQSDMVQSSFVKAFPDVPLQTTEQFTRIALSDLLYRAAINGDEAVAVPTGETVGIIQGWDDADAYNESVRKFYDTTVKNILSKLGKRYGFTVENGTVSHYGDESKQLQLTDAQAKRVQGFLDKYPSIKGYFTAPAKNWTRDDFAMALRALRDVEPYELLTSMTNQAVLDNRVKDQLSEVAKNKGVWAQYVADEKAIRDYILDGLAKEFASAQSVSQAPAYIARITPEARTKIATQGFPLAAFKSRKSTKKYHPPGNRYGAAINPTGQYQSIPDMPGYIEDVKDINQQLASVPTVAPLGKVQRDKRLQTLKLSTAPIFGGKLDALDKSGEALLKSFWQHVGDNFAKIPFVGPMGRQAIESYFPFGGIPESAHLLAFRSRAQGRIGEAQDVAKFVAKAVAKAMKISTKDALRALRGDYSGQNHVADMMEHARVVLTARTKSEVNAAGNKINDPDLLGALLEARRTILDVGRALVEHKVIHKRQFNKMAAPDASDPDAIWGGYLRRAYAEHFESMKHGAGIRASGAHYATMRENIPEGKRLGKGEITDLPTLIYLSIEEPMRDMAIYNYFNSLMHHSMQTKNNWFLPESLVQFGGKPRTLWYVAKQKERNDASLADKRNQLSQLMDIAKTSTATAMGAAGNAGIGPAIRRLTREIAILETQSQDMDAVLRVHPQYAQKMDEKQLPKGYRQIPDDPSQFGDAAGGIVMKRIYDDIMGGVSSITIDKTSPTATVSRMYTGLNRTIKFLYTVANPPTHLRNLYSNILMLQRSGTNIGRVVPAVRDVVRFARTGYKSAAVDTAIKYGAMKQSFTEAEVRDMGEFLNRVEKQHKKAERNINWWSQMGPIGNLFHFADEGLSLITGAASTVGSKLSTIYQWGDIIFKVAKIQDELDRGQPPVLAAAEAAENFFDYSAVNPWVRFARTWAIAPFISYVYFAIPRFLQQAATAPWRMAPTYGTYIAIMMMTYALMGLGKDDQDKEKKTMNEALEKRFGMTILPARDELGRLQHMDFGYILPEGALMQSLSDLAGGSGIDALASIGFTGGPVQSWSTAMSTGIDPFTQQPIWDDTDDEQTKAMRGTAFVARSFLPPSVNYYTPSILGENDGPGYSALFGAGVDRYGQPTQTGAQLASRAMGLNIYPNDVNYGRTRRLMRFQREIQDAKAALTYASRNPMNYGRDGNVSEAGQRRIDYAYHRLMALVNDSRTYAAETAHVAELESGHETERRPINAVGPNTEE